MSTYLLLKTENIPKELFCGAGDNKFTMTEINVNNFIDYLIDAYTPKHIYIIPTDIDYISKERIKSNFANSNISDTFQQMFYENQRKLFFSFMDWIKNELLCGNSIYLEQHIETDNADENNEFNTIYFKQDVDINDIKESADFRFSFNTEYRFIC